MRTGCKTAQGQQGPRNGIDFHGEGQQCSTRILRTTIIDTGFSGTQCPYTIYTIPVSLKSALRGSAASPENSLAGNIVLRRQPCSPVRADSGHHLGPHKA